MTDLLVRPETFRNRIENFGYEYLSFETRKLAQGRRYEAETGGNELAIVVLGGVCSVQSSRGEWRRIGGRKSVFEGLPYTLYLSLKTSFTVMADSDCDLAFCYSRAEEEHPARLVTPDQVSIEIRGGGNATRQIHAMIPPEFPAHRLLVVEVFTPAGSWSPRKSARAKFVSASTGTLMELVVPVWGRMILPGRKSARDRSAWMSGSAAAWRKRGCQRRTR